MMDRKMLQQIVVESSDWTRAWDRYDKKRINKPISLDQFLIFLEVKYIEPYKRIIDNYTHLKFKRLSSIHDLKVGMCVQIVRQDKKLQWEWVELDEKLIGILKNREQLNFIRVLDL